MKKILSIWALSVLILTSFYSCKNEEEDLFDKTSALRLEEARKDYTALLSSADNGWVMEYFAKDAYKGYVMLIQFKPSGLVRIAAADDLTQNVYTEMEQGAWEMIMDNGPVLTFNTACDLIHRFSSPDDIPNTPANETGYGYEGDYEFVMVSSPKKTDQVMLKGKKHGYYVRLTRLDGEQNWEDYFAKRTTFINKVFGNSVNPVLLSLGNQNYELYDVNTGISQYMPENGDLITDAKPKSLVITANGFRLISPLTENEHTVQNFVYDESNDIFTCPDDPEVSIKGIAKFPFMWQQMTLSEKSKTWTFTPSSEMSDKFAAAMQPIINAFKEMKYSVTSFSLQVNNANSQDLSLRFTVRTNRGSSQSGYYYYTPNGHNDELAMTYKDADTIGNSYFQFGVENFVKSVMSNNFSLIADKSNMNLTTIKLVNKSDADLWVTLTLR